MWVYIIDNLFYYLNEYDFNLNNNDLGPLKREQLERLKET